MNKVNVHPTIRLLEPLVTKECFTKDKYNTLPSKYQLIAKNFPLVTKLTITPLKSADSTTCGVNILAPSSFGTPGLVLVNDGRIGALPPPNKDDLRPIVYYAFGTGSYKFKINLKTDTNNYKMINVDFY